MLSIQIDTKSLVLVIYHQFNNIKLSLFASHMNRVFQYVHLIDAVRLLHAQKRPPAISLFYKRRAFQKHVICEKNHWGGNCISLCFWSFFKVLQESTKVSSYRTAYNGKLRLMACKEGQFDVVELMENDQFKTFTINLNAQNVNGMTPFDLPYILCTVIRFSKST